MPQLIRDAIRLVPDFPKPGIQFRDISTLLHNQQAFRRAIDLLESQYSLMSLHHIAAIDARGFIFGAALADRLHLSLIPIRKAGKLPGETISEACHVEYGDAILEVHKDALQPGDRVLVVDDLIATGGTAKAACQLIERLGGEVVECAFIVELPELKGRAALGEHEVFSLVTF